MANLPVPSNAPDIGECIYCGSSANDLGKEHAIPYGLNGPWTLLRASCSRCADITHRFERDTLRSLLSPVRTVLAMQTRRPQLRPRSLALVLESNGVQRTIQVATERIPAIPADPHISPARLPYWCASVSEDLYSTKISSSRWPLVRRSRSTTRR